MTLRKDRAFTLLHQPGDNAAIEKQKAKCREDEAQRPRAESSWGCLGLGGVRKIQEKHFPQPWAALAMLSPSGLARGGRLFPGTCRSYTALIFHPTKICRSPIKAPVSGDFPRNPAHPRGLQSTQQASGCVGSAKFRSTRGIPRGKCITCSCAHSSSSWSSHENPAGISKPLINVNFAENSGCPK